MNIVTMQLVRISLGLCIVTAIGCSTFTHGFSVVSPTRQYCSRLQASTEAVDLDVSIQNALNILYNAAETKQEDSDKVYNALVDLEKLARQQARDDPTAATRTLNNLDGDWRLVFTTGTANTQKNILGGARINYFPLKAVQSFRIVDKDPYEIENGIYFGDWPVLKFGGTFEFDLRKRKLEFDFDTLLLFNTFNIQLKPGEAASLGSKSGLGSDSNVKNAAKNKSAFFNWISADEKVATARGGGGGLALWKRI